MKRILCPGVDHPLAFKPHQTGVQCPHCKNVVHWYSTTVGEWPARVSHHYTYIPDNPPAA